NTSNRAVQNDLIDKRKLKPSNSSKCTVLNGSKWPDLTENTTEITSESTTETDHSSQNSDESSDQPKNDFLTRYPEAVIYSANFQKWGDEGDLKTAKWMFGRVKKLNPSALEPTWYDWANDIRLMRQIDGRTHEQICALFDWANKDSFWYQNILSPRKLRKHFDELFVRSQKPKDELKVQVDTVERDSAFSRLIGSRSKPKNRIEEIALELAGKTGIRRMSEFSGRQAWSSIWKQAIEMLQETQ
ncbi:replication protein, partial [Proteus mirabilis]